MIFPANTRARGVSRAFTGTMMATLAAAGVFVCAAPAFAATAAPGWTIKSVPEPSNFSSSHDAACEEFPETVPGESLTNPCDSYRVIARNVGSLPSAEPIVIKDTLPAGVKVVFAAIQAPQTGGSLQSFAECGLAPVTCEYSSPVPPGGELVMTINVEASSSATASLLNEATVEGGGLASPLSTSPPTTISNTVNGGEPSFAIQGLDLRVAGVDGEPDLQAGDHPYAVTTSFTTPTLTRLVPGAPVRYNHVPVGKIKDLVVDLPKGFLGDPQTTPLCPLTAVEENNLNAAVTNCPTASKVGVVSVEDKGKFHVSSAVGSEESAVYNIVPEAGYPAEFGFSYLGKPVFMYASVLPSSSGYGLRVSIPGLIAVTAHGFSVTFFGDPAVQDGGATGSAAFLTNPVDCGAGPLKARVEADSWEEPGRWVSAESSTYPEITGCDMLQFDPTLGVAPETTQADSPSGYGVDLQVPQAVNVPGVLGTPELKNASVTLPAGVSVSPGAADGLAGCKESGPEGIELGNRDGLGHVAEEGEEPGAGGLPHASHGHCPAASQIGTVEVETPLLPAHALTGRVYAAQPKCGGEGQPACTEASAENGELFGIYLEAEGEGVVIKLKGMLSANPATGQLTARFEENPQLPFSDLKVKLDGGPRAPLANPQTCGPATTESALSPWSSPITPDATPSSTFGVTGCAASLPFAPSFNAGTVTPIGGGFSPFTLTFSRNDGEQDLGGITVQTPLGLLGKIAEVPLCGEPQAQRGECSAASKIGTTTVAAGAGSHPLWLSGQVYLTGSYRGAPFGLSIVVPAKAGPFNLGDEVVRAAISVDSHTAAIDVTSDPLPQHKDGVPFRVKTVNVTIDRPNFMFNPTNCSQQAVTAKIAGVLPDGATGTTVPVATPFAVTGCKNLPFKPSFKASTQAKTSKASGASLTVKVGSGPGQANIGKTRIVFPKQLPARLTTLQKACPDTVFNANPSACPAASAIGTAVAHTRVLASPLTGPVYLVSHGGVAFPDAVIVLQGEGITLYLDGNTNIKKGITSSTFNSVPDAPITSFEVNLPEGPHSAFATNIPAKAKGSMCKQSLKMPTTLTGQNGAVLTQTTKIAVTGCMKKKAKKTSSSHRGKGKATKKR